MASKGAVLGVLMLASHIIEQSCLFGGSLSIFAIMGVEMLVVAVLYIWLLYRFAKKASVKFGDDTLGFSYSQGLGYVVCIALFAGVIVGLGGYIFQHFIIGYDNYIDSVTETMQQVLYSSGASSMMLKTYEDMFSTMAEQPEPGVLNVIFSTVCNYGFWGLIIGLFIAGGVKREPRLFDGNSPEDEI